MTDPISDYLTRLRNAIQANHRLVEIPASNMKKEITKILFEKGYILNYKFENPNKVALILEKKNLAKASGVDTISLNTGTYILTDNQLTATTMYVSNTKALESKLNAEISFLTSDSMVLRTVDGLKRTIISTFSKVQ